MQLVIKSEVLLKYLIFLSKKELNTAILADDSYKIKGAYVGDTGKKVDFTIELLKIDEQTCCAQFNKNQVMLLNSTELLMSIIKHQSTNY